MWTILKALQAGHSLSDPATWKNIQLLGNVIFAILAAITTVVRWAWPDFMISDDLLIKVSTVIAEVVVLINGYLTVATSKKIGVKGE
jgi:hypothetical protein